MKYLIFHEIRNVNIRTDHEYEINLEIGIIQYSGQNYSFRIKEKGNPLQYSCLENPMDRGASWATVHGILQARILEWVAFPSPGDLLNPGIELRSPASQVDSSPVEPQGKPIGHRVRHN